MKSECVRISFPHGYHMRIGRSFRDETTLYWDSDTRIKYARIQDESPGPVCMEIVVHHIVLEIFMVNECFPFRFYLLFVLL